VPDPTRPARQLSPRGRHRRDLILDATVEVLLERGFAAVSHRSVAERAGLPLAATTYYFTSLDDLMAEALTRLAEAWLAQARAVMAELPDRLDVAGLLGALIRMNDPTVGAGEPLFSRLTLYERYLEAARHPRLRRLVVHYDEQIESLLRTVLERSGFAGSIENARLVLAVIDGATLRALAEGLPDSFVRGVLGQLLDTLAPT